MKNVENDKYIINEDYHGDVKPSKVDKPKKVDLSKPTDILEHKSKPNLMPTIYNNNNLPKKINHSNKKICLTKQEDIIAKQEKTIKAEILFQTILAEEQSKKQYRNINTYLIKLIIAIIISLIPIIAYVINNGLDFRDTITLIIFPTIFIYKLLNNKNN